MKYLTLRQTAQRLRSNTVDVRKLCKNQNIEIKKLNSKNYILEDDVKKLEEIRILTEQSNISTLKERIEEARKLKAEKNGGSIY